MDALLGRVEVDGAVDLGGDQLLAAAVADPDRLLDPAHARARQPEPHLGRPCLQVGCEKLPGLVHRRNATNALLPEDPQFATLVMLACHDLRTPLATVHGFAHTLARSEDLDETTARYVEMINAAATQLAELIDDLSVAARLVGGRYDPPLRAVDTLELAQSAAEQLGDERVLVSGDGAVVELDAEAAERAVGALARCALRHGGFEEVELAVRGAGARRSHP